jgi:hypothetical protein
MRVDPPSRVERGVSRRAVLRPLLSGVLVLVVLAGAGVAAAALLRPAPDASPEAERAVATGANADPEAISLDGLASSEERPEDEQPAVPGPPPKTTEVIGVGTGQFSQTGSPDIEDVDGPAAPGEAELASDAEIRSQLAEFRDHLDGVDPRKGARAYIGKDGRAVLPEGAPREVALVVAAANEIATKPYKWGGGHGAWKDSGYDCSGSVSFALAGARLLDSPLDSSNLARYGSSGKGRWITIHAKSGHVFMTVAGLRFDTSGQASAGTRWQPAARSTAGFTDRHPPRL